MEAGETNAEGYKGIFKAMAKEFGFKYVVSTLRESFSATHNGWKAMIYNGEEFYESKRYDINPIIDRVGGGDSFSGGIIHGLLTKPNQGAALEFAVAASALKHTINGDFNLVSTSKNFNPIVVNKSNATIKGATIVAGNADGKDNSDGRSDINDFVGYGTAVNIYGDSVTTGGGADANGQMGGTTETNATYKTTIDMTEGGSITTYGVARPAVAVDNGGDVIIKGDGNDKTQEISVNGGTLYDGFKNTADTVKMVSPPWVLGVVGNSRATNMLGKGSTMVVQDADVYAKSWGALSTDSGSNPFLYAINSNISMDTTSDDASGYGTYAIGNAQEYFLGSTFNVPTYLTIAANGDKQQHHTGCYKERSENHNTESSMERQCTVYH